MRNIRILFLIVFLLILAVSDSALGQRVKVGNIPYREYQTNDTNTYMKAKCKLDISYVRNGKKLPTLIFFHGGGLTSGAKFFPNGALEDDSVIQVAVGYRLSPNVRCPAYIEDAAAAVAWVVRHINEYGGDVNKIYLSGVSAGAYLASMVYLDKSYLFRYGLDPDLLAGLFSYSGQMTTHYQVCQELFGGSYTSDSKYIDQYAPLYHIRKTIKPIYFYTGDSALDMPGRYVQNVQISKELRKLGNLGNSQIYYIQLKGYNHNTFLPSAISGTSRVLAGDSFYNDSIKVTDVHVNIIDKEYPENPLIKFRNKQLHIELSDTMKSVNIYDMQGHVVFNTKTNSNEVDVNTSSFGKLKGVYLVEIFTKRNRYLKKTILY